MTRLERIVLAAVALVTAAAGVTRYADGVSHIVAFALATLALAGGAWVVSFATQQVGGHFGAPITGFLQSTLGNLPEFFVVIFALNAGQLVVAQTAIIGSILVNALLVLGLVIVAGAVRAPSRLMRFHVRLPNDTATLLLTSTFIIVLIALMSASHDLASRHIRTISIVGAGALLIVYATWLWGYLRSDEGPAEGAATPKLSTPAAGTLLTLGGVASAFVSDWFVHSLEPTIHTLHLASVRRARDRRDRR